MCGQTPGLRGPLLACAGPGFLAAVARGCRMGLEEVRSGPSEPGKQLSCVWDSNIFQFETSKCFDAGDKCLATCFFFFAGALFSWEWEPILKPLFLLVHL